MFTTTGLLQGLWGDVASHLWQTTIVLAVLALLAAAMQRAPARLLNALWWIGLAKLLVPVQLAAPLARRVLDPLAAGAGSGTRLPAITVWLGRAAPVLNPTAGRPDGWVGAAVPGASLVFLWAAGAIWLVVSLARARRIGPIGRTTARDDLGVDLRARLDDALRGSGVPASVVRVTRASVMPATIGILRRAILVPEVLLTRLDASELRAVLLHEDAHRRRLDPLQAAVRRAAAVAFYFFPPLWPLLARLRETSEMACDEAAIRRGVAPTDYAKALARTMSIGLEPHGFAAALARGTPSLARRRFERLTDEGRFVVMKRHWFCLAVAVLSVVAISATAAALMADRGQLAGGRGGWMVGKEDKKAAKEIAKEDAKQLAKAVAGGVALALSPNVKKPPVVVEAATSAAASAVSGAAERAAEAAAAREEAEAREEALEAEAAAKQAAEEEKAAAREEAEAKEEAASEEKTYTITLERIVEPEYPEDAKEDGVGGRVTLKLTLNPDGEVGNVATLEEVEGYPSLADAAELAAYRWAFRIEGESEGDIEVVVPIEFKLDDEDTLEMKVSAPDAADEPDPPVPPDTPDPAEPPPTDDVPAPDEPEEP